MPEPDDINADYIDDECLDGAFDDHNDVEMSNECKFDKEVPKEDKFKVTSCVIIDYDKNPEMIEQCNQSGKNRSIYNLVGSFEVDSDVVKEVGDNVEKLDSTSSLKLIAKFINDIALSTDNNAKNNLLNHLINVIKDFNEISSGTTSSDSAVTISSDNQIIPTSRLKIGPNVWNLAVVDNIDISEHTYSYGNIFDVSLVILDRGPEPNSNPNVHESCDMYLNDLSVVSRNTKTVNEHKQAMWKLADELLKIFKDVSPGNSILFQKHRPIDKRWL
ncbi:10074_t:CDS:2 [Entrophospora sp. SA101]|nr:10074_t:CDS:2 [Entrophospora sp. SA101]